MSFPLRSSQPTAGSDVPGMGEYFTMGELLGLLARRKLALLLSAVGGAVLGLLLAWMQPSPWTAAALVQIGEVGFAASKVENPTALGVAIESASKAAERIRNQAFVRALLQQLNLPESGTEARLIRETLTVTIPRNTDLLEVRVAGSTPEAARKHAGTVVDLLASSHAQLAAPTLARVRGQLEHANAQLDRVLKQREQLARPFLPEGKDVRPSERILAGAMLTQLTVSTEQLAWELRQQQLALEEQLSPKRTFPTALLGDVRVPERPARRLYPIAGAALGLLAALCWVLARSARRA